MRLTVLALFMLEAAWSPLQAGVVPRGAEFQVNTYTTYFQIRSSIAADGSGNFVVIWEGSENALGVDVLGRRFSSTGSPVGPEFLINTYTTGFQGEPAVAMDPSGNFVVSWTDAEQGRVFGRLFSKDGTPITSGFQVSASSSGIQDHSTVAMDSKGEFVVVWATSYQNRSGYRILGRRFQNSGAALGSEFQVNTYTMYLQSYPRVAMDASGAFAVVWESIGLHGDPDFGVLGRRLESDGTPSGSEFLVNSFTTAAQITPAVAMNASGEFVVAWTSYYQDGSGNGIFGQRFDSTGARVGSEFQVNTYTLANQSFPALAVNDSDGFVVTWSSYDQDASGWGVFGQRFDNAGAPSGPEFQVNTYTTNNQVNPAVASDGSTSFTVTWASYGQGGSIDGVIGRRFFGRSPTLTSPGAGGTVDCSNPRFSRPTFTWDGDGYDAFRVYVGWDPSFGKGLALNSGDTLLKKTSWTPPVNKWKKACSFALAADPNSPLLYVKIFGVDRNLAKRDPARQLFGPAVTAKVNR